MKYILLTRMAVCVIVIAIVIVTISFGLVAGQANKPGDEFWKQLGITEIEVKDHIKLCFLYEAGLVRTLPVRNEIAIGERAAIVLEAMKYAKQYVSTAEFEKEYQQVRESLKPKPQTVVAKTKENIRAESIKKGKIVIENLQKQLLLPTTDTSLRKTYRDHIAGLKKELKILKCLDSGLIDKICGGWNRKMPRG